MVGLNLNKNGDSHQSEQDDVDGEFVREPIVDRVLLNRAETDLIFQRHAPLVPLLGSISLLVQ